MAMKITNGFQLFVSLKLASEILFLAIMSIKIRYLCQSHKEAVVVCLVMSEFLSLTS